MVRPCSTRPFSSGAHNRCEIETREAHNIMSGFRDGIGEFAMRRNSAFGVLGLVPLCPAPRIGDVDGKKRADCLSPLLSGRVSACSGRNGDAQG